MDAGSREENASKPEPKAFSSEVDAGSREENASKPESRASVLIQSEPTMLWRHEELPLGRPTPAAISLATWLGRAPTSAGLWNNRSLTIRAHDLSQFWWANAREPLLVVTAMALLFC